MKTMNKDNDLGTISTATSTGAYTLEGLIGISFQMQITAVTGLSGASVKIQATNAEKPVAADWFDVTSATATITTNGNIVIDVPNTYYRNARIVFAIAGGSFACKLFVNGKGWK